MAETTIGTVQGLWRYPVKSLGGELVGALRLDPRGVAGDRLHAVRDAEGRFGSGKNTRRFRRMEGLLALRARLEGEVPVVTFPGGRSVRGDDPAIHEALSAHVGLAVTLTREAEVSHFDAGPLHLLTTAALRTVGDAIGTGPVDPRRFRPNLVIEVEGPGDGFPEDRWEGLELSVGDEARVLVRGRTERCVMVGMEQADLPHEPGVLREVARANQARLGVYADVVVPGTIRAGDRVWIR